MGMKRWFLRIAVVLCALAVLVVVPWLCWRKWWAVEQLQAAITANDAKRVCLLIKLGAPVEVDVEITLLWKLVECKLLHWAVQKGHPTVAELLLERGPVELGR